MQSSGENSVLNSTFPIILSLDVLNFKFSKSVNIIVASLVLVSALASVVVKHIERQKQLAYQQAVKQHEVLKQERDRLLLARVKLSSLNRLSSAANNRLGMGLPVKNYSL